MKRALLPLVFLLAVPCAYALQPQRGDRIGVLAMRERYVSGPEAAVAERVASRLTSELRQRGFDATSLRQTYEELDRHDAGNAEWYVEVVSSDSDASQLGGLGIGSRHVGAEVAVVVSRVAAGMRLYDGHTLELVDTFDLRKRGTALFPTAIGVSGRHVWTYLAVPIFEYARYRALAGAVAREAAGLIAGAIRAEAPAQ